MGKGGAIRWSTDQLEEFQRKRAAQGTAAPVVKPLPAAPVKVPKYRSQKVQEGDITHDSKKEARRWAQLQMMQQAGEISDLKRQVPFDLAPAIHIQGEARKKPALRFFADFTYMRAGVLVAEDVKSQPTRKKEAYRIKKHLMATVHNIHIVEV